MRDIFAGFSGTKKRDSTLVLANKGTRQLKKSTLDDGVTMTLSMNGSANAFQFTRMGLVVDSGAVKLSNSHGRSYTIRVKTSGVIRIE